MQTPQIFSAEVLRAAYNMEYPLQPVKGTPPFAGSFVWVIDLCVETVKPAEDGRGVIVRLYNPHNSHVTSYLYAAEEAGFKKCISTNLLEQDEGEISPLLSVGPYEILTVRLV